MMKLCKKLSLSTLSLFLFCYSVPAQVSITVLGPSGAYAQDFSGLGTGNFSLTNNTSITGVYAFRSFGNATPNIFVADNGTSTVTEFKNYGSTGDPDRALGSLADGSTGALFYGIRFQNDTGMAITSLEVRYAGEQWRDSASSPGGFTFAYRQDSGDITDLFSGTYTGVPSLDFITPTNTGAGIALDGNAASNRQALASTFAVTIPAGQEVMLRWTDFDDASLDQGIAIDDVVVIARAGTTAADATISGRVATSNGRGISGARVVLTGGDLTEPVLALTNAFGYFSFTGIESGRTYIVTINSRRYHFANPSRTVDLSDSAFDVNFVAEP
jgi:hypothetical protein